MKTRFFHNVYLCFLPAHTSHGLQPLDNDVFNVVKPAYRKDFSRLPSLTDTAPVDKNNFIRCYSAARQVGMTSKNIISAWRISGNWPINRRKAMLHPEIQPDEQDRRVTPERL